MDYVSRPKMVKKSFIWRSIIAFLGNSQKENFDGLCKQAKNDENFHSLGKDNCLFGIPKKEILMACIGSSKTILEKNFQKRKFDGTHNPKKEILMVAYIIQNSF